MHRPILLAAAAAVLAATPAHAATEAEGKAQAVAMANHMFVCEYMTSGEADGRQFKFYLTLGFAHQVTDAALNTRVQTGTHFRLEGRDYRRSSEQKGQIIYANGRGGISIGEQISWKGDPLPYGLTWTGVHGELFFTDAVDSPALFGSLATDDGQRLFLNCPMVK